MIEPVVFGGIHDVLSAFVAKRRRAESLGHTSEQEKDEEYDYEEDQEQEQENESDLNHRAGGLRL